MKRAREVYDGSNGDVTKAYYAELAERGALGEIAVNLFRAHKCSSRAKKYRGSYKGMAYDRKNWSLAQLCMELRLYGGRKRGGDPNIEYGWKEDPGTPGYEWVLYVDLPQGQVSFHASARGEGPDYTGKWCGDHLSADRILAFCDNVMGILTTEVIRCVMANVQSTIGPQAGLFPDVRKGRVNGTEQRD